MAWLVTDGPLWSKMPELRRAEIKRWLRMNGVEPQWVPLDSAVVVAETEPGVWSICFEEYRRSENDHILVDPDDNSQAYVQERTVPMAIDPPFHWLTELEEAA